VVFLLDANVLVALAWPEHTAHDQVGRWFDKWAKDGWATCPFTQSALLRILTNPAFSANALSIQNAVSVLETNVNRPGHQFWAATISMVEAMSRVRGRLTGHRQITDAYLVALAMHHSGKLATLDRGIGSLAPKGVVELIQ